MTRYLLVEQVLFIHARLIAETGGAHGVRDIGMLLSAVARPQATFDGKDLYPDCYTKAAALLDSLIRNHPFIDGNKRTAITAAGIFLLQNGFRLKVLDDELVRFTILVAQAGIDFQDMIAWIKENTQAVE